jgi:hypothetical protein
LSPSEEDHAHPLSMIVRVGGALPVLRLHPLRCRVSQVLPTSRRHE